MIQGAEEQEHLSSAGRVEIEIILLSLHPLSSLTAAHCKMVRVMNPPWLIIFSASFSVEWWLERGSKTIRSVALQAGAEVVQGRSRVDQQLT